MNEIKNINDLRITLGEEIQKLRDGKSAPAQVNAITNAAGKIISSIKLELEYAKLVGKKPNIGMLKAIDTTKANERPV